jgi:RNA polymerase sigma factor (sigma-70 family)
MSRDLQTVVRHLRRVVAPGDSDRQLLEDFACSGRQDAFTALVRRHGPLVLGVCYRVLQHRQDAEDAFQATFLVLARKAQTVAWQDSISNWLHGVAYRIALKARTQGSRRRLIEAQATGANDTVGTGDWIDWQELRQVLDEELQRLPAKYRAPLLLCYLEGKTRDEAATQLGWSPGSVKGRLERGRDLLRSRLARRGLPLSVVLCATALAEQGATAAVPASLASATIQASVGFVAGPAAGAAISAHVLALSQGVLQAMLLMKVKIATAALLVVTVLGLGTGIAVHQAQASRDGEIPTAVAAADEKLDRAIQKRDEERKSDKAPREEERKDGERKKDAPEARGILKKLDLGKGTVTIQSTRDGEGGAERTYNLGGKNIKVTIAENPGKLSDLQEGLRVGLQLSVDDDVVAIRAEAPTLTVLLRRVDADQRTITITAGERGGAEKSLKVGADARLVVNGRAVKLSDFPAGMRVTLTMSLDRNTVLAMLGGRRGGDERPDGAPRREGEGDARRPAFGVLLGVDAAKGTIEVLSGGDENPSIQTYSLAADAKAYFAMERLATPELKIASLPRAARVRLKMTEDKKVAAIEVVPVSLRVQVRSVDAAKGTLTYATEREEKTLAVTKDVPIQTGRDAGKLADLTPGTLVQLMLTPDRNQVVGILVIPRERDER